MSEARTALVVATDTYQDAALQRLASPTADAHALAEVLGDEGLGGFDVEILVNALHYETAERVEGVLADAHASDLVLLHFSCHGVKNESGELFLAAANTKTARLESTGIKTAWLNSLMRRSKARRVVLLLDCCYGGAFDRGFVPRAGTAVHVGDQLDQSVLGGGRGHVVVTASSAMEYALEGANFAEGATPQPSVFTRAVVEGIRTGLADRDHDGLVDMEELYQYVYDQVKATVPRQTPERSAYGQQGKLTIARNPRRKIIPAELPPNIAARLTEDDRFVLIGVIQHLDELATGQDLPLAAAAAEALVQLSQHDRRSVADSARAVASRIRPELATDNLDLGRVRVGTEFGPVDVSVTGPPLALASVPEVSHSALRARLRAGVLSVTGKFPQPGDVQCTIQLVGPAGHAILQISAHVQAGEFEIAAKQAAAGSGNKLTSKPPQSDDAETSSTVSAEDVKNKTFTPVRLKEGYDMGEVDAFLDVVEADLRKSHSVISSQTSPGGSTPPPFAIYADDVLKKTFTPVKLREGYDMGEVDAFLDQVIETFKSLDR